jgi:predicted ATPase
MSCFKQLANIVNVDGFKPNQERKIDIQPIVPIAKPIEPVQAIVDPSLWREAIKRSNIQEIYHQASIDNCHLIPVGIVDLGRRWLKAQKKPCLYLHGNTGSGKTYFSTALYRALVEKREPWMIFTRSDDLDDELLTAIEERQEKTKITKYCEVPILFIDDLGVERPSDRMIRQYYSIIDRRVGAGLTTVITSNVSKENLPLGDRTISRLGHFYAIEFPKKDNRNNLDLPPL